MNSETDLYETDAAYVKAWERWVEGQQRKPNWFTVAAEEAKRRAQRDWRVNVPELDQ